MAEYKNKKRKHYTQKRRNLKSIFFKFALAIFLIISFIALFYIPKFRIKNIKIENNSNLNPAVVEIIKNELNKKIFLIFPYDNIFILKKDNIAKKILKNINDIKSIKIKKSFPNDLIISFEEKKIIGAYCKTAEKRINENETEEKCFFIDENGEPFKEISSEEKNKTINEKKIILFEVFTDKPNNFSRFLEQEKFLNLTEFARGAENLLGLKTEKITIKTESESPVQQYEVYFNEKWFVKLDSKTDPRTTLENLRIILDSNIKEKINVLEYIDLRLPNKVFFKLK